MPKYQITDNCDASELSTEASIITLLPSGFHTLIDLMSWKLWLAITWSACLYHDMKSMSNATHTH